MTTLQQQFDDQRFANDYQLVNGVEMHAKNPEHFLIPPDVIKRHIKVGHFLELRVDSPRFSIHEDAPQQCACPSCNEQMKKPILRHEHPASLLPLPEQKVPSRGWGEDFWVRVTDRSGSYLAGVVDNPLVEARLHELQQGDTVVFQEDHILAVHNVHRQELVGEMTAEDLSALATWIRSISDDDSDA